MLRESYKQWLEHNFVSPSTIKCYRSALQNFHQRYGYVETTEELINALSKWIKVLRSEGYAPGSINTYAKIVLLYYRDQGITIPDDIWRNIKRRLLPPAKPSTFDKAGTHEEWKRILTHMSLEGRSLFLFLLSTGCRIGETLRLKVSDLDLKKDPPRAYIRPEYTKGGFGGRVVFMTEEAKESIEEYLHTKFFVNKREAKHIYNPKLHRYVYPTEHDGDRVWNLNESTVTQMLHEALRRAGLDERDPRTGRHLIHVHSTRKFFRSNCGLPDSLTHALMGHSGYLDQSYLRVDPQKAGEEYKSVAMPRLTIFERTTTDKAEVLRLIAKALGVGDEKLDVALKDSISLEDSVMRVRELIQESIRRSKQYLIVDEDELQGYLLSGWDVAKVLNDGRFLLVHD